jgi:hypothetical protein
MVPTATASEMWFNALLARVIEQATAAPVVPDDAMAAMAAAMVAPTATASRPRAVSSFSPFFGVAIQPLAPDEPYTTSIILPFEERSMDMCRDELEQQFMGIFS